jgi:hypothetical protein
VVKVTFEAERSSIQLALQDPNLGPGKKGALPAIHPLNKALHPIPPQIAQESYRKNHIDPHVFTQPGSKWEKLATSIYFPLVLR